MRNFVLLLFLGLPLFLLAQNQMMLPDTMSGNHITLDLQTGTHTFYSGIHSQTMGANGYVLGPTVILNKGQKVTFKVRNHLPDTTTIHWHGLHVAPENDGGPHTYIVPGKEWNPSFTVLDNAATYWYHPHLHHKTDKHVSKGIAGLIIVRDQHEAKLELPRTYGVDDIPVVMQTKHFDNRKEIVVHTNTDDVAMVNATINAHYDLPAQVVRLRLLNGSSQRVFNVGMSDDMTFYQIASDGGLLEKPAHLTRLMLSPGERAEILVNLSQKQGDTVYLKSYASELPNGIYGAATPGMMSMLTLNGYSPNPLNGADFNLLEMRVVHKNSRAITTIPTSLVPVNRHKASTANITRNLSLNPATMGRNQLNGNFLINNTAFDMHTINYTIPLNSVEIWSIQNMSGIAHPFHIHDVQFNVLDRNGSTPSTSEMGWKDVVLIRPQETVRFITKFEDFADTTVPYMYHCHMLVHEDGGMMGQFVVEDTSHTTGLNPKLTAEDIMIYPNPSTGRVTINLPYDIGYSIDVYNSIGQKVIYKQVRGVIAYLDLPKESGVYTIRINTESHHFTRKVIIE